MVADSDIAPTPGADLDLAVAGGLDLLGRLLSRGERHVVTVWQHASPDARGMYARLFARRDRLVRCGELVGRYDEIGDATGALDELVTRGLAWRTPDHWLPLRWRLPLYDRPELARACGRLGLPRTGKRATLEARLLELGPQASRALNRAGIRLRHRGLLRRLCSAFLGRPDGDLRALVLDRMGTVRFATYEPTGGTGLFPDRRTLLQYESARAWAHGVAAAETVTGNDLQRALALVAQGGQEAPEHRRYRACRYGERVATAAAEALDRARQPDAAMPIWEALSQPHTKDPSGAARRLALCFEKQGTPREGARVCASARDQAAPSDRLALERTGRRLARRARVPWRPLPPLSTPPRRTLEVVATPTEGRRPSWDGRIVENAVAEAIRNTGRHVVEGENLLWTTLFGVLLRDVIFAPVPEMLPGRLQMAPLDLGLPSFAARRSELLATAIAEIRADNGHRRLQSAFEHHHGEAIRGVSWQRWSFARLDTILAGLGGALVSRVLQALAHGAPRRGLPDLVILRGDRVRVPGLFPGRLPEAPMFVEVKGPGDSLRDAQQVWLDRLSTPEVRAEVWDVRPSSG